MDTPCTENVSFPSEPPEGVRLTPRILLADDDAEMRALLALVLRSDGYHVVEYSNGTELVRHLEASRFSPASPRVDLIICDMRMPGVTGLEVLERLREHDSPPPLILITAFGDAQLHARAQELGVAASIDKPFELEEMLALVQHLLASRLSWEQ